MATKKQRRITEAGAKRATTSVLEAYDEQFVQPWRVRLVRLERAVKWIGWGAVVLAAAVLALALRAVV